MGFFKQFADPNLVSLRASAKKDRAREQDFRDELADSDGDSTTLRASGRKKQLSTKLREQAEESKNQRSRVASAGQTKKTFEDEIRDLESAARSEAGAQSGGTTPAKQTGGRTPASRSRGTPVQKTPAEQKQPAQRKTPTRENAPAGSLTTTEKKTRGRPRKNVEHEPIVMDENPVPEIVLDGDSMEVDDSEEETQSQAKEPTHSTALQQAHKATPRRSSAAASKKSARDLSNAPPLNLSQLQLLQSITLEKIHGKRPIPLTNLSDEYSKVSTVIGQTITAGESNSMLLIGARGSGKTALVNQILQEQAREHPDDFHAVRLNGFIHTDDKIALREIWRQLGREMELDEDENTTRNYADTLASLLALLSHPLELGQEQAPGQTNKSVVFILDEFELFASHPRQTLLYNLFDIAQSRKAPIAVLGLTTRIDVAESLEKRVKSRFSHRYVHLSSSKSFPAFVEVCKSALTVRESSLSNEERTSVLTDEQMDASEPLEQSVTALDTWNGAMESLLSSDPLAALLRRIYFTSKSVLDLLAALVIPIATLPASTSTHADILDHLKQNIGSRFSPPDSKLTILSALSTLQLALLICAARQTAIHATETVSFNLAYEEYKVLASKAKIQAAASGAMGAGGRVWSKEVSKDAWMTLINVGLVLEDSYSGRGGGGNAGRVDVSLEEIGESGVDLGTWGRWCREI